MKLSSTGLAIELTLDESELFSALPSYNELANDWDGEWSEAADVMEELYLLLKDRGAIPELRLKIFIDPQYAEKGSKSIKETFESNGTKGREIIRHPHFTEYIDYFVNGPALPKKLITDFCELADNYFTQSEELRKFVRQAIKQAGLTHYDVPRDIFRLAIERGLSTSTAGTLRKEAMTAIRK